MHSIDVILVNYRGHGDTLAAIAALGDWTHGCVHVVDNSEDRVEADILRGELSGRPGVLLTVTEKNLGFGKACNLAFSLSDAEYVLLLNPDARMSAADIALLAASMDDDPHLGAVSPLIYWDEERRFLLPPATPMTPRMHFFNHLGSRFPGLMRNHARRWLSRTRQFMAAPHPVPVPFHAGAALMVRRSAAARAGGLFDPSYFMFYEDSDLSLRLRQCGYRLAIVPAATAVHGYRHASWKEPLMRDSEKIYFHRRFPLYWRLTKGLSLVERLAVAPDWLEGSPGDFGTVASAAELAGCLGNREVVALSPCPTMVPALFRPLGSSPATLSDSDWERLGPGRYLLLTSLPDDDVWRYFSFMRPDSRCPSN